ncbi:MAG: signal peptide peptidase SppA, partial [Halieaceae bacterium]|nr:signal peptide peptidase SppA [Halieaceae bacterium]
GSIGVFAAFPTVERLLERVGIHTDGVGTTRLAGALRLDRPLKEEVAESLGSSVEFIYQSFVGLVAQGRGMTVESVDAVAQGRVWSAPDALSHGLIDKLGDLSDAIDAAATLAELDDYTVDYVELPVSPRDLILQQLAGRIGSMSSGLGSSAAHALSTLVEPLVSVASEIASLDDPGHFYIWCVACGVRD